MTTTTTTQSPIKPLIQPKEESNIFRNLLKVITDLLNFKTISSFLSYLLPNQFVNSLKLMGNTVYHTVMLGIFILIIYFTYYVLQKQIISMLGLFIMGCIIGLFYIKFSFNSQKTINKYSFLFNKLCSKYKDEPLCAQYLTLQN